MQLYLARININNMHYFKTKVYHKSYKICTGIAAILDTNSITLRAEMTRKGIISIKEISEWFWEKTKLKFWIWIIIFCLVMGSPHIQCHNYRTLSINRNVRLILSVSYLEYILKQMRGKIYNLRKSSNNWELVSSMSPVSLKGLGCFM